MNEPQKWTIHLLDGYFVDGAVCNSKNTRIVVEHEDYKDLEIQLEAKTQELAEMTRKHDKLEKIFDEMTHIRGSK